MGYGYTSLPLASGLGGIINNPAGVHQLYNGETPQQAGVGVPKSGGIPWGTILNAAAGGLQAYGAYRQNQDALKLQQEQMDLLRQRQEDERKRQAAADPLRQHVQQMIMQRIAQMTGIGGGSPQGQPPMPTGY